MGVRASWLVDAARLTGYPVTVQSGCFGRGHGDFRVIEGVGCHHTAGPRNGDYPSLLVVRDGRAGLKGPLSNYGLGRSGTIQCIADGVSYHAGASNWAGFTDLNDEFIGIEAESMGTIDDWTPPQRDCYPRLVAAILFYIRRDASRAAGHKEICRPAGRKIDPAFWDMKTMRSQIAWYLEDPLNRIPRFKAVTPARPAPADLLEDDMGVQNFIIPPGAGVRGMRLNIPTGKASSIVARSWVSMSLNGPKAGSGRVFAQSDHGGIADRWYNMSFKDGLSTRDWWELPDGTTQAVVQYDMPDGGTITLEWAGK